MSRLYLVTDLQASNDKDGVVQFLVEATSQRKAIAVVTADRFEVKTANSLEVARLITAGVKVLNKSADAPVPEAVEQEGNASSNNAPVADTVEEAETV